MTIDTQYLDADGDKIKLARPALLDMAQRVNSLSATSVTTIANLKLVDKTKFSRAIVLGYYTAGDGGGGIYYYDAADTTSADNGGSIIVATDGGRWKLPSSGIVNVKQFGAKGDGVTDDTPAVTSAISHLSSGGVVFFPNSSGRYKIGNLNVDVANITFRGTGTTGGGILTSGPIWIRNAGFTCENMDLERGGVFSTDSNSLCFGVYNKTGVDMRGFSFLRNKFNGFFFSIFFFGMHDELPAGVSAHTTNPIYNTRILYNKSTGVAGQNCGHFQHTYTRDSLCMGNETFYGKNCSSYNFVHDCRDIKIIFNRDYSSEWGGCEIENSPRANGLIAWNVFSSATGAPIADVWIDDSSSVNVFGNNCNNNIFVSCANDSSAIYYAADETCSTTVAIIENNTAPKIVCSEYAVYASGVIAADISRNTLTGTGAQAIFGDSRYVSGRISANTVVGTFTNGLQLARGASTNFKVFDNQLLTVPVFTGSGGSIVAYDNDVLFTEQAHVSAEKYVRDGGWFRSVSPAQSSIAGGAVGNIVFTVPQTVTQFSMTDYTIKVVSRNSNNGDQDAVEFNVLIDNPFGTIVCTPSALTKRRSNTASNFTVSASMTGTQFTLSITNANAAPNTISVRAFVDGIDRL